MTVIDSTQQLLESSQSFLVPLRMGQGFLPDKFEAFCIAIKNFNREWEGHDVIPKPIANVFVDAYTAIVASSYLYPAEEQSIREKADMMNDLIRACCE